MNFFDGYRYLTALQQHRHFGRAAAACHITQPALSNALRALEEHFGVPLVRRGRQFEGFTPEGEQVLATAHRMLHEQEALQQQLKSQAGQPQGRLVLGVVPTAVPVAARFLARLLQRHPLLRPQLRSLSSQEIEQGLETLGLDLGLGYTDRAPAKLRALPQYLERYYLLQRRSAGTAASAVEHGLPMAWTQAARLPLALLAPEMHNRAIVNGIFGALGLRVKPVLETNAVLALITAVKTGDIAAVLPGAVVATIVGDTSLQAHPLVEPEAPTPVGFMLLSDARQTLALQAALRLAEEESWLAEARVHSGTLQPQA